ncbi:MAG: hypothetical protein JOY71_31550 [Acetobacteraceae bacterium]|nr:hypothetical protein [Acetobacteraceae bacterium]MBV8588458.1 hypothetical protein [Acetobacteraceae bacterium]
MAVLEDILGTKLGTGIAVGLGAAVVGPLLIPATRALLRPAAKLVVQGGIAAYRGGLEAWEGVRQSVGDLVAEAQADLEKENRGQA